MIGFLAYWSARRTARLLKQESRRPSACVTEPFDAERYDNVTKKQNAPTYVNVVDMARSMVIGTVMTVVLCLFTDLSWWWVLAPLASYTMYGLTCRTQTVEEVAQSWVTSSSN
jgi:hypothetical protein